MHYLPVHSTHILQVSWWPAWCCVAFARCETLRHTRPPSRRCRSMEKGPPEYAQSTVHSSSATPTSEYGLNPSSSRSSTFPEYLTRQPYPEGGASRYHPPMANQSGGGPGMAPTSNPSSPLPPVDPHTTGRGGARSLKSDPDMVTDPGIAATSPTYPPPAPYASYPPPQDMSPAYPGQPGASNVYGRPPDWGHYPPPHPHGLPPAYGPHPSPTTTVSSASPSTPVGPRPGQVRRCSVVVPRSDSLCDALVILITSCRYTHSFLFPAHSSINVHDVVMRRLSGCTSAVGTDARRLMEH